jgi:hypothetical protein
LIALDPYFKREFILFPNREIRVTLCTIQDWATGLDQETLKEKSLELIHETKRFLLLEKVYEESLTALLFIKQAKLRGGNLESLPKRVLSSVGKPGNLDEAEKTIETKMSKLRVVMSDLSSEIRELSDLLAPFSTIQEPEGKKS